MKKLLLSILTALFIVSAPLFAFEWGGLITDTTGITTPDFSAITFNQSNGISLWFNSPLGEDASFSISGEGLYKFNFTKPDGADGIITHIVDVPLLKLSGDIDTGSGIITLNAGRFSYVDGAGAVYVNTIDGASVDFAFPLVKAGFIAGYTGLLNALNVGLPAKKADAKFYSMAYAYAPVGAYVEFPSLFANQSLTIQGYAVLDLGGGKTNSYYGNVILGGPITNSIFYSLASSFGSVDFKNLMNYSALTIIAFPTETLSLNLGAEFGSADNQGPFSAFTSIASPASSKIAPKAGLTFATSNFSFDLSGKYNLAYDGSSYKGADAEVSTGIVYNVFSDFQIGLNFKATINPKVSALNNYVANLNVALAF